MQHGFCQEGVWGWVQRGHLGPPSRATSNPAPLPLLPLCHISTATAPPLPRYDRFASLETKSCAASQLSLAARVLKYKRYASGRLTVRVVPSITTVKMATTMAAYPCAELRADFCGSTNNLHFTANLITTWHYSCVMFHARKIFLQQGALPRFSPPNMIVMYM